MKRLTKLANKYDTDKGTECRFGHSFTDFYEPYLTKFENPTILEIGTAEGSSAKMFNDFFDGDCTIYTVDINAECGKNVEGYSNIHFFQADCGTEEGIRGLIDNILRDIKFDIIIEDASHLWDHQMMSLYFFSKHLNSGGIYILEDLHTSSEFGYSPEQRVDTPLFYLNFFEGGMGLYDEERAELTGRIKDVIIFNRFNEKNYYMFKNRSVTSIITFR